MTEAAAPEAGRVVHPQAEIYRDRRVAAQLLESLDRHSMPRFQSVIWENRHRIIALMLHGEQVAWPIP